MLNRRSKVIAPSVCLLMLLVSLGLTGTADAQSRLIAPLGAQTVGSKLDEVRAYERSENCRIEGNYADCAFTDANGVEYVVMDDSVIAVSVTEKKARIGVKLPFGLKLGESLDTAAPKLVSGRRTWVVLADPDTSSGIVLSSEQRYDGKNGWDFIVELVFDQGGLVSVKYQSGTI